MSSRGVGLCPTWRLILLGTLDPTSPLSLLRGFEGLLSQIKFITESAWRAAVSINHHSVVHVSHGVKFPPVDWQNPININMMPIIIGAKDSIPVSCRKYYPVLEACLKSSLVSSSMEGCMGYLTIQESEVPTNTSQRRPGLHTETPGICRDRGSYFHGKSLGWGQGWAKPRLLGGIFMASTLADSCEVWENAQVTEPTVIARHGDVEHLRATLASTRELRPRRLKANEMVWITDTTPHESLPLAPCSGGEKTVRRQYFRLVAGAISVWYAAHSTPNPIPSIQPEAEIIHGNKFGVDNQEYAQAESGHDSTTGEGQCQFRESGGGGVHVTPQDCSPIRVKVVRGRKAIIGRSGVVLKTTGQRYRVQLEGEPASAVWVGISDVEINLAQAFEELRV
ncbi:hypothetical protein CYMTET_28630 [Cymbomonas tetramitiformis]|uniref:Uncharacterized protein n=1 Tax=Cymbomonas tetramitiformis TaxID=36881 RepID=A0AAE0FMF3_9CHLO|nr:hypothetical protein CYMTET_28630 [Cymbomonas tetramitiformis]